MERHEFLTLNIGGQMHTWSRPVVMGILNPTPDSFFAGSRVSQENLRVRAGEMIDAGADILDIGGFSTRPGASWVSMEVELTRLLPAVKEIRKKFPDAIISVDTFRSGVARKCVEEGADIINDISGGTADPHMFETVADLKVPYILMHTRGTPDTMTGLTDYDDVTADVLSDLAFKTDKLHQLGVSDVIIDPGFGFAKTREQNFEMLASLRIFTEIGPVLAGMSRKSMVTRTLDITADEALNGTTALNMAALMNGAVMLRVHDVKEACETVRLYAAIRQASHTGKQVIITQYADGKQQTRMI